MTKAELKEQIKELEDIRRGQTSTIRNLIEQLTFQDETLKVTEKELRTANEALEAKDNQIESITKILTSMTRLLKIIKTTTNSVVFEGEDEAFSPKLKSQHEITYRG